MTMAPQFHCVFWRLPPMPELETLFEEHGRALAESGDH